MKIRYFNIKLIVFGFGILSFVVACNNSNEARDNSTFNHLCQIYENIVKQPIALNMKEMKITESVQKELPDFFEKSFSRLVSADPDFRYKFIKRLADEKTDNTWECDSMRHYYENEFNF